jgi:nucleoside-triphosphatase THEP1
MKNSSSTRRVFLQQSHTKPIVHLNLRSHLYSTQIKNSSLDANTQSNKKDSTQNENFPTEPTCTSLKYVSYTHTPTTGNFIPPLKEGFSLFSKFREIWKKFDWNRLILTGGVAITLFLWSYDDQSVKRTFKNGTRPQLSAENYTHRESLEEYLVKILSPKDPVNVSNYYVVTGEQGSGKTTIFKKLCTDIGEGVIYVEVPESIEQFGDKISEAIGYKNLISFYSKYKKVPENWLEAFDRFKSYASWYREKYNKIPVIVIDDINRLAQDNSEILRVLQEGAKTAVSGGHVLYTIVFVTSDGAAPSQMICTLICF